MRRFVPRAGRWPLAFSFFALTALVACSDEPVAPRRASTVPVNASGSALASIYLTVTNTSGGTDVGSLRWAAAQVPPSAYAYIRFDSTLAGDTIALDAELVLQGNVYIDGFQNKGIVISGKNQHRVMRSVGFLSLWNVTVTDGYAEYGSGVAGPRLFINHSNVQNNRGPGSAIYAESSLTLQNATVSGNVNGGPAVEYASGAQLELRHTTIAFNAPGPGLGVRGYPSYATMVKLHNTIVSNNGSPIRNCNSWFGFVYGGTNISSDWSCGEVGIVVADPLLMPLANNGGSVMTHAIPHTSPAFNTATICNEYDARYVRRNVFQCDVGAFEFDDFTKITITIEPNVKLDATGKALLTGTITCTRADTFRLALELHQDQKIAGKVVDVHSASDIPVSCTTIPKAWSASMGLAAGEAFKVGNARATANTFDTPAWATPASVASAVKIARK